ncbi:MAG TPA: YkvA family protein [Deinococcales bacterium]|nr:YkvA family protein [Deinococcales bacterium]
MTQPVNDDKVQQVLESTEMKARVDDPAMQEKVKAGFQDAATKVRGKLGELWDDLQVIYQMAFDKQFDLAQKTKYVVVGALVYLVLPVDIIPDAVPLIGLADDAAVIAWAINFARPEINRFKEYKNNKGA